MRSQYSKFEDDEQEEKVEDSFDFFQPKKTKFEDENSFQLSNTHKKAAKLFAAKIVKDAGVVTAPVEVEKVLEFLKKNTDYRVDVIHTKEFSDRISALTLRPSSDHGKFETTLIVINDNHHPNRQRFSFAHELGHIYFNTFHKKEESERIKSEETDAHFFASELMIPTVLVKEDLKKCKDVIELAKKYEVSKDAMFIKIQSHNLLKYF